MLWGNIFLLAKKVSPERFLNAYCHDFLRQKSLTMNIPRILISGLSGGSGKTLLSLGLCRAFSNEGLVVKPYKKGPDYIDAHWLSLAAKKPCTNLDPYFLDFNALRALFSHSISQDDFSLCIIEGNRGLFDGQDVNGTCSSAELSRIFNAPVIISLDITKMTRTAAAILSGIVNFEKDIQIGGVILNQVGSLRHGDIVQKSIEYYTDIPVLGALPRLEHNPLPERHMGLSDANQTHAHSTIEKLAQYISTHCNMQQLLSIAKSAPPIPKVAPFWPKMLKNPLKVRIGYVLDAALWFYYEENLEALRRAGAELVPISLLDTKPWPSDISGIYLGGGYPEEFLEHLSTVPHLELLRKLSESNMPIYAECGGFMVLSSAILRQGKNYPMSGIFPAVAEFHSRPQGLGYVKAKVKVNNPFHAKGLELRGHEFHYSCCLTNEHSNALDQLLCLELQKGTGMGHSLDGLSLRNTFASYTHIYAPICPWWAENFVHLAHNWRKTQIKP